MPTSSSELYPEEESYDLGDTVEAVDTTLSLTGIPDVDVLLRQVTDAVAQEKLRAYVYSNLIAGPKLQSATANRAVYTIPNSGSAFTYTFTDLDIAWLARSLHGEGGPKCGRTKASALAWTMFNRFMLNPRHWGTSKFWIFLQGFSQPINPKWRRDGSSCRPGAKFENNQACSEKRLLRREQVAFGPIPPVCLSFAEEMARGTLAQPAKPYIDFASYKGMDKWGDKIGGDNFLTASDDKARLAARNIAPIGWTSGSVRKTGNTTVVQSDTLEPRKKEQLLSYIANYVDGVSRAAGNQVVNKSTNNSTASSQSQAEAVYHLQQTANAVQIAQASKVLQAATVSEVPTGSDGFQIGSDDTWNRV